ncbi:hypothetical protein LUZ61_002845 [Rhynchospora tenuis]|uniref:Sn1-specific diacylglycerol lipase alpha n=1 Tax=Rhynchospora tenuis TaxID=198213 RepID=A0AAD5ZJP8_9POAL|nr:hypothetical protein LUZ61_002845 [Rhynchospora tenuis]
MATATVATAAGAAALLYYTLNKRIQATKSEGEEDSTDNNRDQSPKSSTSGRGRVPRRPVHAPATWLETISTLSETLRFTYSETLGKWPLGDLAFGISFLLKRQGNLPVASIYAGNESIELGGVTVIEELKYLLNLLILCWHFSKKPFPLFLEATGYSSDDVILQEPKAGILKPAFTIITDKSTKCILLLIRGTHSIRDTLTAATGAVVPFHHTVVCERGVREVVLGYAHCGMVAAARWIAKLATPCLTKALQENPNYKVKIVGHSLGGGTAALLTYILREQQDFSAATCVAFAPAACMTWELAESGTQFITSVINGADLVPTFSAASVDDLRTEVTASAWLNDLRNQIEQTRILSTVYRSASALGSRLPSIANAKARVVGAGAILRPVSTRTQVVMSRAKTVARAAWARPSLQLSSWSCIGPRRRNVPSVASTSSVDHSMDAATPTSDSSEALLTVTEATTTETTEIIESTPQTECLHTIEQTTSLVTEIEGEKESDVDIDLTEVELWQQLETELSKPRKGENGEKDDHDHDDEEIGEEEDDIVREIAEASASTGEVGTVSNNSQSETKEVHRFYPPGKIMHIVSFVSEEDANTDHERDPNEVGPKIGVYLTPRSLYGKLRLSKAMINDHYMPMYRRNIEQLISELEKDACSANSEECTTNEVGL